LIALTPSGRAFSHAVAVELAALEGFSLLCGRYEGIDQRALDLVVDDEISLGDFVLAGGELAALCVIEAVVRLRPGALGNDASSLDESFSDGLLEYRTTPSRPRCAVRRCPRYCVRVITPGSRDGAAPRRCTERSPADRTSSRRAGPEQR